MGASMKELGLDRLTPGERITLAMELWESLGDSNPGGLTDDHRAELARRDAELDANPGLVLTWEQIRAGVEGRR